MELANESHSVVSPHVHQPSVNIAPKGEVSLIMNENFDCTQFVSFNYSENPINQDMQFEP